MGKSKDPEAEAERKRKQKEAKPWLIQGTDDPRYLKLAKARDEFNARRSEEKKRREQYKKTLSDIKAGQLEIAQKAIEDGVIPEPIELMIDMIREQKLAVANPDTQKVPSLLKAEKALLLEMTKEYTKLLGAAAPQSQSVEVLEDEHAEKSSDDFAEEFKKFKDVS